MENTNNQTVVQAKNPGKVMSIIGFVMSIISFFVPGNFVLTFFILSGILSETNMAEGLFIILVLVLIASSFIICLIPLVLSIISFVKLKKNNGNKSLAITGIVLSAIGVAGMLLIAFLFFILLMYVGAFYFYV